MILVVWRFRGPVYQTRGNQTEVARMLSCARGTVLKYNRDSKGERHVIVNGVLMVKQGKRGRR
ncbi:protein ninH [Escherichia coli]|uniref:protein ninH n=1 Tax=Escherichia coli TaxID=562 RepID=UPI000BE53C7B